MRKLIITTAIFLLAGLPASYARGGMHGGGGMHGLGASGLTTPANPSVPPSLTPDSRLVGAAPLPPHHQPTRADMSSQDPIKQDPQDAAIDKMIGNICRGC